jgi:hypothetical protein
LHDDVRFAHWNLTAVPTSTAGVLWSGGSTEKKGEPAFAGPP